MTDCDEGCKRPRIEEDRSIGKPQLLLATSELQKRTGKKYCDESELLSLLLAHGLVRRVRTITVEVRPLSGESFDIQLDASHPTVGEAKEQIERNEGTKSEQQLLCLVQVSSDGSNVREYDQEPEELKEDEMALMEDDVVAMVVIQTPKIWRMYPTEGVNVCDNGKLVMNTREIDSLAHTGEELTEGTHYCEMTIMEGTPFIGVCRPDTNLNEWQGQRQNNNAWLKSSRYGGLYGNGKQNDHVQNGIRGFRKGDRMGVLLDLHDGSLTFFKNGVEHSPGYPPGSVVGPVAFAVQMIYSDDKVRLLPNPTWPDGHC